MLTSGDPAPDGRPERSEGRVVFYEVCLSFVLVTLRRPSRLYRLRSGEWGLWRGLPYTIATLLLGWWGVPWGLVYTPRVLWTNLTGGRELTPEEMRRWGEVGRCAGE